jgi:hypothetical protein
MGIPVVNDHAYNNLLTLSWNLRATYQSTAAVGDIVVADTSGNWVCNTGANNATPNTTPMGEIVSVEKGSNVATVRMWNVRGVVTKEYSTVASRGSNVILANDDSTVTGSATVGAQDNTYIVAVDTTATTLTWLVL